MEYLKQNWAVVIPVSDTMLLPDTDLTLKLEGRQEGLQSALRAGTAELVVLPLRPGEDAPETRFARLGVRFAPGETEAQEDALILRGRAGERVAVSGVFPADGLFGADAAAAPETRDLDGAAEADMLRYLQQIVREIGAHFRGGDAFVKAAEAQRTVNALIVYLAPFLPMSAEEKYEYLKLNSLRERGLRFLDALLKQRESVELNMEISEKLSDRANRFYRRQVLREQLKAIREELGEAEADAEGGEGEPAAADGESQDDFRARIGRADMPEEVRKAALAEARKLEAMAPGSAEEGVVRNYLEFMLALPWKKAEAHTADLAAARRLLDEQHYGLDKVKERIIQHLAVMQLKKDSRGSILLLVGPPGTGKTSLGRSIAEALGRKYVRLSLGGIRDEAEIRGHRRTYVGAMPGRILQSIRQAGTTDPVMVLDEVDKLMNGGFSGDPAGALLEVLDPEQNSTFTDHYLDLPYDLSGVFFIATANSLDTIPGPLLDRMEVITVSGYTADEKFHIARRHLLPDVLRDHGLTPGQLVLSDETLRAVIDDYTLEAGVRGLKKQLAAIARVVSEKIVSGTAELPVSIGPDGLEPILGRRVSRHDRAQSDNPPGVVTGLAWTPVGGEILFIEATDMPGSGEVTLTGQLGDVMKESARISLSLLKSRLPQSAVNFRERDLHIHVPSGAVPKDGPSAGIALFTALASLFTGKKVDPQLAMTGEITLRGAVLPIGGLKEKLLGAQRAGIRRVLIPRENLADLADVPAEVRDAMTITPVETVEDVLRETIGIALPRIEHAFPAAASGLRPLGA